MNNHGYGDYYNACATVATLLASGTRPMFFSVIFHAKTTPNIISIFKSILFMTNSKKYNNISKKYIEKWRGF